VNPYVELPHGCRRCPRNLCKVVKETKAMPNIASVIISDANSVFIDNILNHFDCRDCFERIFTNPARYEASGALRVNPYVELPHGCRRCPRNLCKGQVLDDLLKQQQYDQVVYAGDGSGDFCPCTRLKSSDIVLARLHYPNETAPTPLLQKCMESETFRIHQASEHGNNNSTNAASHLPVYAWKDQSELASLLRSVMRISNRLT